MMTDWPVVHMGFTVCIGVDHYCGIIIMCKGLCTYGIVVYTMQLSSGSDLGMLLVEDLKDKKTPVSDELLG